MSRLRAYAQLLRLPNLFTALADIALGAWVASTLFAVPPPGRWWLTFTLLLAASACL
jgi:4-hydroxybenzoate polyprenyltransferase